MEALAKRLDALGACSEAVEWAATQPNDKTAWQNCTRGDWMLWLVGRLNTSEPWSEGRKALVLCAAECASLAEPYVYPDSLLTWMWCIDALERWAIGEADQDEVIAARDAAAAAYAADAAAAAAAVYAAAAAVYAAAAAAYAADAAAYAADAAAAAAAVYAAAAAARAGMQQACADVVRKHFPKAPVLP